VKPTGKDASGYAVFSNSHNASLLRYSASSTKSRRQKIVDDLWGVYKGSRALLKNFTKKGGSKGAWEKALKNAHKSLTSGPNGSRGSFFELHAQVVDVALKAATVEAARVQKLIHEQTRQIATYQDPSPAVRPWAIRLVGPPDTNFDATPEDFWFEECEKRLSTTCHDTESRRVYEDARQLAEGCKVEIAKFERKLRLELQLYDGTSMPSSFPPSSSSTLVGLPVGGGTPSCP